MRHDMCVGIRADMCADMCVGTCFVSTSVSTSVLTCVLTCVLTRVFQQILVLWLGSGVYQTVTTSLVIEANVIGWQTRASACMLTCAYANCPAQPYLCDGHSSTSRFGPSLLRASTKDLLCGELQRSVVCELHEVDLAQISKVRE